MKQSEHCRLCNHQEIDLKVGTICGLTKKKPDFNNSCPTINFSEKLEDKIKEVNVTYENIRRKSTLTYIYTIVILTISISVMIGGWYLGRYVYNAGVISTVPLTIIGIGFLLFPVSFGPLNFHRRDLKLAKAEKNKIDDILSCYDIDYDIEIKYGREIHGTQEVFTNLKLEKG